MRHPVAGPSSLSILALALLIAADGDCALDWLTAQSPVQAVASVMQQPRGEVVTEVIPPFSRLRSGSARGSWPASAAAVGQLESAAAVAQIIPAALWLAVRVVFLLAHADRRSSASASRS